MSDLMVTEATMYHRLSSESYRNPNTALEPAATVVGRATSSVAE